MSVVELYRRALDGFGTRVHAIAVDGWHRPTPCSEWDVAAVVNHLVGETCWAPPLLAGCAIADVGDRIEGDLLADDPVRAWDSSAAEAAAAAEAVALDATVHLSFGDFPAEEYLWQLTADALIHGWDVARATGQDASLDPMLVDAVARWFADKEGLYRAAGVIGPAARPVDDGAQSVLLSKFGRNAANATALVVIGRFNEAFNRHDVDELR